MIELLIFSQRRLKADKNELLNPQSTLQDANCLTSANNPGEDADQTTDRCASQHVERKMNPDVDASPRDYQAKQSGGYPYPSRRARGSQEAKCDRPNNRQVIAWKRWIGLMGDQLPTEPDHEWPRVRPDQTQSLIEEEAC